MIFRRRLERPHLTRYPWTQGQEARSGTQILLVCVLDDAGLVLLINQSKLGLLESFDEGLEWRF